MQQDDRQPFVTMLASTYAYYRQELSEFVVDAFWECLQRFDLADIRRAINLHVQDPDRGQWCPKIADLTRVLEGSTQTQGMRAWVKVEQALRCVGAYQTVVFDDPLIHAVVTDLGGWTKLCQTPVDEMPFVARDFERRYAAYRTHRDRPPYPAKLIGIAEHENALSGHAPPRPVLIGDPNRAALVFGNGGESSTLRITQAHDIAANALDAIAKRTQQGAA